MDYLTKPTSRNKLRALATYIRSLFKCRNKYRFDVIEALEKIHSIFTQVTVEIVEDDDPVLGKKIPCACSPDENGECHIQIKESVYEGAYRGIGGYRAHILHEMCHAILYLIGFKPILARLFNNYELRPFESAEWQAKALCGEIMVPYEATKGMSVKQIKHYCGVSKECAEMRIKLDEGKKES